MSVAVARTSVAQATEVFCFRCTNRYALGSVAQPAQSSSACFSTVFTASSWQIRRVVVFVQDALHHYFDLRTRALTQGPINRYALAHFGDEFRGDHLQLVITHGLYRGFVR